MDLSGKHIMVTGGAGRIGAAVVALLLERGAFVTVLDNFSTGERDRFDGDGESVEVIEGDVTNPGDCEWAVAGSDIVVHLAQVYQADKVWSPREAHDLNVGGTLCLLEAMQDAKVHRIVLVAPPTETQEPFLAATLAAAHDYADAYCSQRMEVRQISFEEHDDPKSLAGAIVASMETMD